MSFDPQSLRPKGGSTTGVYTPHRPRGTAPRGRTAQRLRLQEAMGWPSTSKLVILNGGFMHPTKGYRRHSPGCSVEVKPGMELPPEQPRKRTELQKAIQRMTNWQRTQFARTLGGLRREQKTLKPDAMLALALACGDMPRREAA